MQKILSESYLLHTQPFKETSLILRMFGKHQGRFSLVAKGVKRKPSQSIRAILQPFRLLQVEFTGKSELKTLCSVEIGEQKIHSTLSNRGLACGYYLNELLIRATEEWQESPKLFESYQKSLRLLQIDLNTNQSSSDGQAEILRAFEVALLTDSGVAPEWAFDSIGNKIESSGLYHYIDEQGFSKVKDASSYNLGFKGESLIALGTGEYKKALLKDCQQITQMLVRKIIGNKPLESRKLWI
ncbi:MAG: DNA repair protein RecO [Kangiellaceae bacterium]|nr:DNA repair protein RecO [Kangiellaceae bacterium]